MQADIVASTADPVSRSIVEAPERMTDSPTIVRAPAGAVAPVVFDSPHSGFTWPADFMPTAPADAVRSTWDAHVERLFEGAPSAGATLLAATFPRAYIDVNRAVSDLDPALIDGPWSGPLDPTDYSRRGMGLIRRDALPGVPMYAAPLAVAAVRARIDASYRPYRARLSAVIEELHSMHGVVWHVNCHSMKSRGNAMNVDAGATRPDLVISDRRGTTAEPGLAARIVGWFTLRGYRVQVNDPYQGGDLVRTFGDPARGRSSVQIEINRALYMDEATTEPHAGFAPLQEDLTAFAAVFAQWANDAAARARARG